jgi:hypothetical protein
MPFIRGRYHINPIMGEALEAAREAEEALLALEHESRDGHDSTNDQADGFASSYPADRAIGQAASGPIHRVEIEAAEMVPSHSGRAERGFVARVHRHLALDAHDAPAGAASQVVPHGSPHGSATPQPETHVFSDHRDLVNFLHDELAKEGLPGRR